MPLPVPRIADLNYDDLLQEALARVPVHNPDWTNLGEGDPGVTILQLFAFMAEQLAARCNQMPERSRRQFLSLLRIPMQPASPARGFVTFTNDRGPLKEVNIPPDLELRAGQVVFRSQAGLDVLPIEAAVYYKQPVADAAAEADPSLYARFVAGGATAELRYYRTAALDFSTDPAYWPAIDLQRDTADGSLWIALLARPQEDPESVRRVIAGTVLNLGILPDAPPGHILPPQWGTAELLARQAPVVFEMPAPAVDAQQTPLYNRLKVGMTNNILESAGLVTVRLPELPDLRPPRPAEPLAEGTGDLPPHLDEPKVAPRLVTWLRLRLAAGEAAAGVTARLRWAGINADLVHQRVQVESELVGRGTGEPDQSFRLVHGSVLPGSVQLTVGDEPWQEIDDLLAAGPEVPPLDRRRLGSTPSRGGPSRAFALDPESGEISFGNGIRGARPREGVEIWASYRYGGGKIGNVDAGAINKAPTLPIGLKVTSPLPTWGGVDAESVAEAEKNVAAYLKHRNRLVTAADFAEIVRRTPGVDVGRVEVMPLLNPDLPGMFSPGTVTVLVFTCFDDQGDDPPLVDRPFLSRVSEHAEPRRLVTTELFVRGPVFRELHVSVGIEVSPRHSFPAVRAAVNRELKRFLSPLHGGPDGTGWPVRRWVTARELFGVVSKVEGVSYVRDLVLGDEQGDPQTEIHLTDLELPWLRTVETHHGDPVALGGVSAPAARGVLLVPVLKRG